MLPVAVGQLCCSPTYGRTMAEAQPRQSVSNKALNQFFIGCSRKIVEQEPSNLTSQSLSTGRFDL
jgi:hypothetical protein